MYILLWIHLYFTKVRSHSKALVNAILSKLFEVKEETKLVFVLREMEFLIKNLRCFVQISWEALI